MSTRNEARNIHGNEEGTEDRRRYLIGRIDQNLGDYIETLDRAIRFLWTRPHKLDVDALSLLSINGKIELLRKLIIERSSKIPISHRSDYLARFDDDLTKYAEVEILRSKALRRYLIEPSRTWLRELVDTDDGMVSAWFVLDESMSCEHKGYIGLIESQRGRSVSG